MYKIYLAGGWCNWRQKITPLLKSCEFLDPPTATNNSNWFELEVEMIKNCDAMICFISKENNSGYKATFEMGMAYALGKPYVLINEKTDKYQWGMQTKGAKFNFSTLHEFLLWAKITNWCGIDVCDFKYYPVGVPCKHIGCFNHISHPCEECGRIGGEGDAFVGLTEQHMQ